MNFKWEQDDFWFELLRLDEIHPALEKFNFILPDKLFHAITTFYLGWIFIGLCKKWGMNNPRLVGTLFGWLVMMVPWEIVWDGMFRYGASWKDMIANTIGALLIYWWSKNPKIGQMHED